VTCDFSGRLGTRTCVRHSLRL